MRQNPTGLSIMEDVGDDFGDLYADVEIQASSAINGAPNFERFYEDDADKAEDLASGSGSKELGMGDAGSSRKSENDEPNVVDNESDSEDDFNIVLNDEDGQRFPVRSGVGVLGGSDGEDGDGMERGFAGGERGNGTKSGYHLQFSQYKYVRSHSTVFPSNAKANETAKVASCSSMLARSDWEENGSSQLKGSSSVEVASTPTIAAPLVAQGGYGFSLPWYRTILDVNIDTFEQKPWRHPGVDLTDFFNFGFNEETWKNYCNSLEQYRRRMYILNQTPVYHSSKPKQTDEVGLKHEKDGQEPVSKQGSMVSLTSKSTDRLELPKGRAIQVEGSTGERQPSMDVRRPRYRDSDVVIHIAVQDSVDDEIDNMDSIEDESSENRDFKVGDNKDIPCNVSGDGNKPCLENNVTSDRSSILKRSSKLSTASNPLPVDSDDVVNGKIPNGDRHCSQNMNADVPEGISEVVDALHFMKEMVGRNICNTDPCIMETELSLDEQVSHSPSSSRHGSHSEASQDGGYVDPEKDQNARRKPSSNLLTDQSGSIKSEYYLHKNSKNKVVKTKTIDRKDSFRNKSPVQEARKHRDSRLCSVDKLPSRSGNDVASPVSKTVDSLYNRNHSSVGHGRQKERLHDFGSHDDISPISNSEGLYYKHYLSAGHRQRKERLCDLGSYDDDFSPMSEEGGMHSRAHPSAVHQGRKKRPYNFGSYDNDIFPMSQTEGLGHKGHSFASCCRRKERLHDFDSYDREGFSYYRETELSFNNCSEKFADNHVQTAYAENPHWRDHRSFRDEMYPHFRNKYFFEKRITRAGNKMMETEWYHRERNLSIEDMDPLTHRESRQLVLKYYSDKERESRWRKKSDKLQFQKGPDNDDDDDLFQCKHTDDFTQEKFTRSVPFMGKERNSLAEKYGRHVPSSGRKVNLYGRRKRYEDGHLDLDGSSSIGVKDECGRHVDCQSLSSRSYREPHTANARNDASDSRLTERHGRDRRQICPRGYRGSDWFGNHNDAYNTEDSIIDRGDQVHIGRRRSRQQYEALHSTENELISSHLDENLYNEEASLSYERTSGDTMIHTKYGSAHVGMLIHDKKSQQQRYKRIREGRSDIFINRSSNVLGQGNHEQTVPRSRASVDLIVREGKSSGRRFEAGSTVHHERFENVDRKIDEDWGTPKDVNGPQRGKIIQPDVKSESNWNNEKCLDKFLVTEHDETLDIEEGQIIPEEIKKDDSVETKHISESIASTRNVKRRLGNANAANGNKVVAEYNKQWILQTLAKMEKRQERFKEPIPLKKEPDKVPKPQADPISETAETMQQRPVRKRRWNGS